VNDSETLKPVRQPGP